MQCNAQENKNGKLLNIIQLKPVFLIISFQIKIIRKTMDTGESWNLVLYHK